MPEISAVSLANVVAQAQARASTASQHQAGYVLGPARWDAWPPGYQMRPGGAQSGLNPQPLPPGSLMRGGSGVGLGRILGMLRQAVMPRARHAAGQIFGSFGGKPGPTPHPLCTDTRYWVDGAPPAGCVQFNPVSVQLGEPQPPPCTPVPCSPQPCSQQPCAPVPCMPQPCEPTAGGPLGGMQVCPPCAPPVPWGWMVVTGIFALLGSLQFYGKVGGGRLS